ncbi:MAG: DUF4330 family protein [bacterium]|nr:DUF4330 family protein [bacterium]
MRIVDDKGRLFGRVNLLDLFLCAVAVLAGVVGYVKIMAPERSAPVYSAGEADTWVIADVALPPGRAWMVEPAVPGATQIDPRTGTPIAEIVSAESDSDGLVTVRMRLRVAKDSAGRLVFGNILLLPGQRVRIETDACVIEGNVARIADDSP